MLVGDSSGRCPYSPPVWQAQESHDKRSTIKAPESVFIGEVKSANGSWCGETVLRDPPLSSVRVSRCWVSVLCSSPVAGQSHTALWKSNREWVSGKSSGDISHQCVWLCGFCSCSLMRFSCGRPARKDCVQVFLLCFQGDADECSGHASQYIYIY